MFPPETMHTIFPVPAFPDKAQATEQAPAPSAITWLRSANNFTASATDCNSATSEPAINFFARANICGNTSPCSNAIDPGWLVVDLFWAPAASEAESGAAVVTSAANTLQFGRNSRSTEAIPQVKPPPPHGITTHQDPASLPGSPGRLVPLPAMTSGSSNAWMKVSRDAWERTLLES